MSKEKRLTPAILKKFCHELVKTEPKFQMVIDSYGYPPLWNRESGFSTLVHIILEQQVSLESAKAAMGKLQSVLGIVRPESFLELSDFELKTVGFSRQKTAYCRDLAVKIINQELLLDRLEELDSDSVRAELIKVKGIGRWTSDVYLLMVLLRPDIWPKGDIALAAAYKELFGLTKTPTQHELEIIAERWRPFRSVAARLLWTFYLGKRGKL